MKTFAICLTAAAALAAAASPASADEGVSFSYRKSDLASSASVADLYERIVSRAERVCEIKGPTVGLYRVRYQKECVSDLVGDFVAGVGSPPLTALHEQRHNERFAENR